MRKMLAVCAVFALGMMGCDDDSSDDTADAAAAGGAGGAGGVGGEGGMGGEEPPPPPFGQPEDVMMAQELWGLMADRGAWDNFPGLEDDVVESAMPHSDYAIISVNEAFGDGSDIADGAIVVKDNVADETAETLDAVTAMWKVEGFNPDEADWFFAKYLPDGSLDTNPAGVPLAGKVGKGGAMGCIPCHSKAGGGDFLYSND